MHLHSNSRFISNSSTMGASKILCKEPSILTTNRTVHHPHHSRFLKCSPTPNRTNHSCNPSWRSISLRLYSPLHHSINPMKYIELVGGISCRWRMSESKR